AARGPGAIGIAQLQAVAVPVEVGVGREEFVPVWTVQRARQRRLCCEPEAIECFDAARDPCMAHGALALLEVVCVGHTVGECAPRLRACTPTYQHDCKDDESDALQSHPPESDWSRIVCCAMASKTTRSNMRARAWACESSARGRACAERARRTSDSYQSPSSSLAS